MNKTSWHVSDVGGQLEKNVLACFGWGGKVENKSLGMFRMGKTNLLACFGWGGELENKSLGMFLMGGQLENKSLGMFRMGGVG